MMCSLHARERTEIYETFLVTDDYQRRLKRLFTRLRTSIQYPSLYFVSQNMEQDMGTVRCSHDGRQTHITMCLMGDYYFEIIGGRKALVQRMADGFLEKNLDGEVYSASAWKCKQHLGQGATLIDSTRAGWRRRRRNNNDVVYWSAIGLKLHDVLCLAVPGSWQRNNRTITDRTLLWAVHLAKASCD